MRTNKYDYYRVIQSNHGYGWDDEDYHETTSDYCVKDRILFLTNLKAYKENCSAPIRVIKRRELAHDWNMRRIGIYA